MSSVSALGMGRLNENALRDFPFVEDSPVELSNGYVLPQDLVLDLRVAAVAESPGAQARLSGITLSGSPALRSMLLTVTVGGSSVAFSVPANAALPYSAAVATSSADAVLVVGAGLSRLFSDLADGAYTAAVPIEPACVSMHGDKRVNTLSGTHASTAVAGRVRVRDGYNAYIDVRADEDTIVLGAFPGAGVGAQCGSLYGSPGVELSYTGQPRAGETFVFGDTQYVWGPISHPQRVYLESTADATYASIGDAIDALIAVSQSDAWGSVTLTGAAVHDATGNTLTLDTPMAVVSIPGPALPEAGDTFTVFGEAFEFGTDIDIGGDAAATRANVAAAVISRVTSARVVSHVSGATTETFVLADVQASYSAQPAGGSVISFYGWDILVAPEPHELLLGVSASATYATLVSRLSADHPDAEFVHVPGTGVTISGSNAVALGADFNGLSNATQVTTLRSNEACARRLLYVNGVHADAYGNISLEAGPGFEIAADPETHTIRIISRLNGDDLECKEC